MADFPDFTPDLTPVEYHADSGIWVKRDDLWTIHGVSGGKARSCYSMARGATGLVTAGSRSSPQINIVAHIAKGLGVPCRCHCPQGELTPELLSARDVGAEIIQHRAGYNSVIKSRAASDARATGYREIPFGMECLPAITETSRQVVNLPKEMKRVVIAVGSGMSLCGVLYGLRNNSFCVPVVGVVVGADPRARLKKWAPFDWSRTTTLVPAGVDYHKSVPNSFNGMTLDSVYEAKVIPFLQTGDCLWVVGIRQTERKV